MLTASADQDQVTWAATTGGGCALVAPGASAALPTSQIRRLSVTSGPGPQLRCEFGCFHGNPQCHRQVNRAGKLDADSLRRSAWPIGARIDASRWRVNTHVDPRDPVSSRTVTLRFFCGGVICARSSLRRHQHATTRNRCMKRSLALLITALLLPLAAVATREPLETYCAVRLLRCAVLEILMYIPVHCGSCAPCALHSNRSLRFLTACRT